MVVVGAGAAGMMCAIEAGRRGRSVLVIDHARAPGEKIRISGGGRCNFTNLHASAEELPLGQSELLHLRAAPLHAKRLHRPDRAARHRLSREDPRPAVLRRLLAPDRRSSRERHADAAAELRLSTAVEDIEKTAGGFSLTPVDGAVECASLVVASGGKSIPKMGATGLATTSPPASASA